MQYIGTRKQINVDSPWINGSRTTTLPYNSKKRDITIVCCCTKCLRSIAESSILLIPKSATGHNSELERSTTPHHNIPLILTHLNPVLHISHLCFGLPSVSSKADSPPNLSVQFTGLSCLSNIKAIHHLPFGWWRYGLIWTDSRRVFDTEIIIHVP
jgi:hypothetical protein